MFVGCFNLCFTANPRDQRRLADEEGASLIAHKKSFIKITDRDCTAKLPIPTDKDGMTQLISKLNSNFRNIATTHYEFRILNPNEKPIRNDRYIRYRLQIFNTKIGIAQYELYLIVFIDAENETVFYIKSSHNVIQLKMPDWLLIENIFRSAGYIAIIDTRKDNTDIVNTNFTQPPSTTNSMK